MENNCKDGTCNNSNCNCNNSNKKQCCDTGCDMCNEMVKLADRAWEEIMVEKMKALWLEKIGDKMDQIASASVETSMAYHMNEMKGKTEIKEAAKRIKEAFASH